MTATEITKSLRDYYGIREEITEKDLEDLFSHEYSDKLAMLSYNYGIDLWDFFC